MYVKHRLSRPEQSGSGSTLGYIISGIVVAMLLNEDFDTRFEFAVLLSEDLNQRFEFWVLTAFEFMMRATSKDVARDFSQASSFCNTGDVEHVFGSAFSTTCRTQEGSLGSASSGVASEDPDPMLI